MVVPAGGEALGFADTSSHDLTELEARGDVPRCSIVPPYVLAALAQAEDVGLPEPRTRRFC